MCGLCRVEVEGQSICAACFDRGRSEGSLQAAQTTFRSWSTLGWHLAILGLVVYPLGLLAGPVSLFATARGVAQSRKEGDEGGALGAVFAVLLGLTDTAVGVFLLLVLTEFARRKGR
jgi:hypothetical protein